MEGLTYADTINLMFQLGLLVLLFGIYRELRNIGGKLSK